MPWRNRPDYNVIRKKQIWWDSFWGSFFGFVSHGMTCKEACCGCGGGNKDPDTFDDSLPIYDGVPEYPYDMVQYELLLQCQNKLL